MGIGFPQEIRLPFAVPKARLGSSKTPFPKPSSISKCDYVTAELAYKTSILHEMPMESRGL